MHFVFGRLARRRKRHLITRRELEMSNLSTIRQQFAGRHARLPQSAHTRIQEGENNGRLSAMSGASRPMKKGFRVVFQTTDKEGESISITLSIDSEPTADALRSKLAQDIDQIDLGVPIILSQRSMSILYDPCCGGVLPASMYCDDSGVVLVRLSPQSRLHRPPRNQGDEEQHIWTM